MNQIREVASKLEAVNNEVVLRYMIDVIYRCEQVASAEQKRELLEIFKSGDDSADLSFVPSQIFMNLNLLRSKDDLKIPKEQASVHK
mmetsp:Transcript_7607/g.8588  ORF Transcript_7607/g.8588 Transcript_7607/m.8588 type:complete len:87 (+) Transcript_7607:151-411(+)